MLKSMQSARVLVVAAMMACLSVGCSDAGTQRWNEFWGVDSKPRRRTVRTAPNNSQQASNNAGRSGANRAAPAESNGAGDRGATSPGAEQASQDAVDHDVDAYVANMNPPPKSDNAPNDIRSKIRRQNDPERHKRIETAAHQDSPEGDTATPADDGSAIHRYEKNTGVEVETADAAPKSSEKPAVVRTAAAGDEKGSARGEGDVGNGRRAEAEESTEAPVEERMPSVEANATPRRIEATPTEPGNAGTAPEIAEISVEAGPKPEAPNNGPAADGSDQSVSANAPIETADAAESFQSRIEAQSKVVQADPNNLEEQYKLRMMYLIDGQDEKAKAVIPGVDADIQDIMTAQIESLISARSTSGRDPATWATRQLESMEELRRLVKQRADLVVPKVVLCTEILGYGRYSPIEPAEFKVGKNHRVLIYSEVDNFTSKTTNSGMYRTLMTVRQTLLTKEGKELWSQKIENIEDMSRRPRRDFYLSSNVIPIPKTLPVGDYLLKVEVEDVFAGKMNSNVVKFKITE